MLWIKFTDHEVSQMYKTLSTQWLGHAPELQEFVRCLAQYINEPETLEPMEHEQLELPLAGHRSNSTASAK